MKHPILLPIFILTLFGCSGNSSNPIAPLEEANRLFGTRWILDAYQSDNGVTLPYEHLNAKITMGFLAADPNQMGEQRVGGGFICNGWAAPFEINNSVLTIGVALITDAVCDEEPAGSATIFRILLLQQEPFMIEVDDMKLILMTGANEKLFFSLRTATN